MIRADARPEDYITAPPNQAEAVIRVLVVVAIAVALIALADLALRSALRLENRWDTFMYHLPFSALRGGIPIPFEMNEAMLRFYHGFPPLPHLLQGALWRITGSINATGVVSFLAFCGFLVYCHVVLGARFWLVALIALTAPLVVIHAAASYVDLFGNSLLAIGVGSCLFVYLFPERASQRVLIGGLAGLVGAAWSKFQLVPLVGVFWGLYLVVTLFRLAECGLSRRRVIVLFTLAGVLAAAPYLKNLIVYGNPFWPVRLPLVGDWFPYAIDSVANGISTQRPPPLKDYGQFRLFLHSLFEIGHPTHYDLRPRWIIDQGNAWIAFRMGGFWGIGTAFFLVSTIGMLVALRGKAGIIAGAVFVALLCFVGVLPQSNELRYYLLIPLTWAATIGMLFPEFRAAMPRLAAAFLVTVLGLFAYMVAENSVHYRIEKASHFEAAREYGASNWWPKLRQGVTYCAVDMMPLPMMMTGPTLSEFRIVDRSTEVLCPEDSIVLTSDGTQRRKGDAVPVRADPDAFRRAAVHIELSRVMYDARRFAEAIAAAGQALAIAPDNADAYNNICAANNGLERWDEAITACSKAIAIRPDYPLARNNLAWAQKRKAETAATNGR